MSENNEKGDVMSYFGELSYTFDEGYGERFNPFKMFWGILIPIGVVRIPVSELSQGAKLVYGRLYLYAGENSKAYPSRETLATEVGCSTRQVDNYIKELKDFGLIEVERRGCGYNNNYYFLTHHCLDESFRLKEYFRLDSSISGALDEQNVANALYKNQIKRTKENNTYTPAIAGKYPEEIERMSKEIYALSNNYKKKIDASSVFTAVAFKKVVECLDDYTIEQLNQAIDNFSKNPWYMKNHRYRGYEWFFKDVERVAVFIGMEPYTERVELP